LPADYLSDSERPWISLIFLLPLVLAYQAYAAGWMGTGAGAGTTQRFAVHIRAFLLLQEFFSLFGVAGIYLPAIALAGMLMFGHFARRDHWRVRFSTLAAMGGESILWAVPLLAIGWLMSRLAPMAGIAHGSFAGHDAGQTARVVVLCFGAGVYEEMVFRLIGATALSLILGEIMGLRQGLVTVVVACLSGVLFSLYHYLGPQESFRLSTFGFRTAAGAYFTLLFCLRGFGITAACHAAYDVIVVALWAR
jgi:hypothetical protein